MKSTGWILDRTAYDTSSHGCGEVQYLYESTFARVNSDKGYLGSDSTPVLFSNFDAKYSSGINYARQQFLTRLVYNGELDNALNHDWDCNHSESHDLIVAHPGNNNPRILTSGSAS